MLYNLKLDDPNTWKRAWDIANAKLNNPDKWKKAWNIAKEQHAVASIHYPIIKQQNLEHIRKYE